VHRFHILERPVANPVRLRAELIEEGSSGFFGEVDENKAAPGIEVDAIE
jgi:hypothetical protein